MINELSELKAQLSLAQSSLNAAIELRDYETVNILSEKITLISKQIMLCQKQQAEEAKQ